MTKSSPVSAMTEVRHIPHEKWDITAARRAMKVDKPRPLKIATDQSMDAVLAEMDSVSQHLASNPSDRGLYTAVISLCENLKMFGPQLENVYKDQLDRCFVAIRNGCRDDNISLASRYRLLEVIELRAMHWQPNENVMHYYKQKLAQIEAEECAMEDDSNSYNQYAPPITPTNLVSPMFNNMPQGVPYPSPNQPFTTPSPTKPHLTHTTPHNPPTLSPGEIIKSSGKYTKPTRIPGKNFCKDEVVIRNPDSGKVMGLKGRRVHMIEELSETIISFQRVSPGARERLVQITGPNEENITQAKQLIEETIRRNSSPVRQDDRSSMYNNLGGSSSSISSHTSDDAMQVSKRSLGSLVHEEPLTEYKYTVIHNDDVLRITGSNLDLVRTAKLVLDEFFNSEHNLNNSGTVLSPQLDNSSNFFPVEHSSLTSSPSGDSGDSVERKRDTTNASHDSAVTDPKGSVFTIVRQPLIPSSSKEAIGSAESEATAKKDISARRALFAKTSETQQSNDGENICEGSDVVPANGVKCYSRDFMIQCASSPLSRRIPNNWASVVRATPMIIKKGQQHLASIQAQILEDETKFHNSPSYLEEEDLLTDKTFFKTKEYKWSLVRSLSGLEEDDVQS